MRINLTCLILLMAFLQITLAAYAQKISLSKKNAPLTEVFKELKKQSGYGFMINKERIKIAKPVTIDVNGEELINVLDKCFKDQPFTYRVEDKMIIVVDKKPEQVKVGLLDIDVKGRLVDENGNAMVGASVIIKGTERKTITDSNGEFSFKAVEENVILEISYIGYETKTIKVTESDLQTIKLELSNFKLQEVSINAGYYKVTDRERTGSIAKVSAEDIKKSPITNVLTAVQGRMAGVSITQNSGVPGGGYDIQIRGRNSLRSKSNSEIDGNQPLYIVDGVPLGGEMTSLYSTLILPARSINPLNSINPSDIESIEILKDADATAIYGSRGANGVVLLTTKKGKSGKAEISFSTTHGLSQVLSKMDMLNTDQYLDMRRDGYINDGITNYPANAYDVNGVWSQNRNTDWQKELIGNTALSSSTQLSITGGSETTTFLISAGHQEQSTVFAKDFKYISNSLSNNISHRSKDNKFQLNISNMFSMQKNNVINEDVTKKSLFLSPNAPELYLENGNLNWENNTFTNPVAAYNASYSNINKQFLTNINSQYEIVKNVLLKLNSGINYQTLEEKSLQPNTIYNPSFVTGQSSAYSGSSKNNQDRFSLIVEPQINWQQTYKKHKVDVLVGGTFQRDVNQQGSMTGVGFESNIFIENIGAAQTKIISDQVRTEYQYAAVFGRFNYQFDHKYILNITGRRDGSSRFGPNNRFANFGALGAAWIFSKEKALEKSKWFSFGKLRASFGTSGSDNIGDYQYLDTYSLSSLIYNSVTGLVPSRLYNPDYSWEKTTKWETALELGFLRNQINFTGSWYRNRSNNQLIGVQLPAITGFASVLSNLPATVENSGVELELSAFPFKKGSLKWETFFNISFPKNKLLSFPNLEGSTYANQYLIGQPTSIIKLYQLDGINPQTGIYQFKDFNGDGKISSPDDNRIIENVSMRYFGGWNNSLGYKNWDFSILFQFVKQRNRNYNSLMPTPGGMNNQPVEVLNVWSLANPNGQYMAYSGGSNGAKNTAQNFFRSSSESVSDASFIRLKNIQLSYRIPIQNASFKNLKIFFQGQNLMTWTKYFGVDPEFLSIGYLPPLRTYAFGIEFNL